MNARSIKNGGASRSEAETAEGTLLLSPLQAGRRQSAGWRGTASTTRYASGARAITGRLHPQRMHNKLALAAITFSDDNTGSAPPPPSHKWARQELLPTRFGRRNGAGQHSPVRRPRVSKKVNPKPWRGVTIKQVMMIRSPLFRPYRACDLCGSLPGAALLSRLPRAVMSRPFGAA